MHRRRDENETKEITCDKKAAGQIDLARLEARISILNFLVAATKQLFLISSKPLFEEL